MFLVAICLAMPCKIYAEFFRKFPFALDIFEMFLNIYPLFGF